MLFLLRKLRKMELHKRSWRYFVYAVGEIMLIMVGILLALQVQTWNQNRLLEQDRRELIKNLKADFSETRGYLIEALYREQEGIDVMSRFLLEVVDDEKALSANEIGTMSKHFFRANRFAPRLVTYRQASLSGSIQLLRNNDLVELLHRFEVANGSQSVVYDLFRQEFVGGGPMEIRRRLGSLGGFR